MIYNARVVKLVNTLDLKSSGCNGFTGSIPVSRTTTKDVAATGAVETQHGATSSLHSFINQQVSTQNIDLKSNAPLSLYRNSPLARLKTLKKLQVIQALSITLVVLFCASNIPSTRTSQ